MYCFDTDKYDSNPDDARTLQEEKKYCDDNGYGFVWFCHDIEEVFLGKSVPKTEKTNKAREYITSNRAYIIKKSDFQSTNMVKGRSNLVQVIEKYFV